MGKYCTEIQSLKAVQSYLKKTKQQQLTTVKTKKALEDII